LAASKAHPAVNPAFVVKDWGKGAARVKINGKPAQCGRDLRFGHRNRLEGADLVLWMNATWVAPATISISQSD
jgi:hypothetical protein